MNPRTLALVITPVVVGGALWWYFRPTTSEAEDTRPTAQIAVAALQSGTISQQLEAYGVVEAAPGTDQVTAAPFDCLVTAVLTEAGAEVAPGDVLLQVAPSPETQLLIEAARSALVVAQQELNATQQRFDLKLATQQELTVARQAEVEARAKVLSYKSRGVGEDGKVRATAAGVVSKLEVTRGSLVTLGAPLVSVATGQGREARLELEGSSRVLLARNQQVTLSSSDNAEAAPVTAHVRAVGAALNAAAGSLEVRVPVPAGSALLPGEHVRALIDVKQHTGVLIVPRSAVLPDDGAQVLYTVKDNKAVRHEVTLGIAEGELQEVAGEGLAAGDSVVITGNYELADGMAVETAEAADGAPKADTEKTP